MSLLDLYKKLFQILSRWRMFQGFNIRQFLMSTCRACGSLVTALRIGCYMGLTMDFRSVVVGWYYLLH
ncbi:hypothetical protein BAAM0499_04565 [Bifidobacterium animalis subsp. animalis MCC 0499]|nr:hypothetical protein BAAM0499_04565 [Bifidobacterium animalis subsp. animalis MCC 0499]